MLTIPAVDLGATHTRRGLILLRTDAVGPYSLPKLLLPEKSKKAFNPTRSAPDHPKGVVTDLPQTLERAARSLKDIFRDVPIKERRAIQKTVGICAPGAWLESGVPYQGTVPNIPDLEGFKLAEEFARLMGEGWAAVANNDGVASVLAMAFALYANRDKFPLVREALAACGRIAGFIPGTGFGGGALWIEEGRLVPVPGPQQFFDLILDKGDGRIHPGFVTPEDLATGEGLRLQAFHSDVLKTLFKPEELTGEKLAALADHGDPLVRNATRELYRRAGEALAKAMILTFEGGAAGQSRKAVVNDPPELETNFWMDVKGTRVFILGGWLTSRPARDHTWPTMLEGIRMSGHPLVAVPADEIPGVRDLLATDSAGLVGAALLCPLS